MFDSIKRSATYKNAKLGFNGRVEKGLESVRDVVGKVWPWVVAGIAVRAGIHGYVPEGILTGLGDGLIVRCMSKSRRANVDELCAMFKALSNPQRLRMFLRLSDCCGPDGCAAADDGTPICVGDLSKDLDVAPSTVSHHLKELRQAGLIHVERRGQKIECWASEDALRRLATFFGDAAADLECPTAVSRSASTGRR